ncbi:MAG: ATP-dependent sacrificial sulfur transferase LarE [bacterium]|nr:ATP-dependent sacrificial sulfur transferase LarE [bacterium]
MADYQKDLELGKILSPLQRVLVCYSGGVDSSFLLKRALEELGEGAQATIVKAESFPQAEFEAAMERAEALGVKPWVIEVRELEREALARNEADRCYHCKSLSFGEIAVKAQELGITWVLDGTNADDLGDYRPGLKAREEQGVRSPLAEVGLGKNEIRNLSKQRGLSTWDLPSSPCLNSRVPYGDPITLEKLRQIGEAEAFLRSLGFKELRVRHHGAVARVEVPVADFTALIEQRGAVESHLKSLGFSWVALDLGGFRSGSLNEALHGS